MNQLLSYSSDNTDSEESDTEACCIKSVSESDNLRTANDIQNPKITDDGMRHQVPENVGNETETDFFNLQSSSTLRQIGKDRYNSSISAMKEHENDLRKVVTSEGELEVPGSDFWMNFKPTFSTEESGKKSSHDSYYVWQLGVEEQDSERPRLKRKTTETLLISDGNRSINNLNLKKRFDCDENAHDTIQGTVASRDSSSNSLFTGSVSNQYRPQTTKSVFYIHSKVSPYLHTSAVNKCSKVQSDSWSAEAVTVNRINWNIANYSHLLLAAGNASGGGVVSIWNVWSSVEKHAVLLSSHKKSVKHAEWLQDGRAILSCSYDRTALITDVQTEKTLLQCEHAGYVTAGCCHPSNHNLFLTGSEGMILMWDRRIPDVPVKHFSYKDTIGQVQDLVLIKDGRELISCSNLVARDSADRNIIAWDMGSGVVLSNQIFQERFSCTRLKEHPSHQCFLAQTHGGYIAQFSITRPYKMDRSKRFEGHRMQGYSIGFDVSPDGRLVYSGSSDSGIHCYDYHTGRLITKLASFGNVISDVACHPVLPSVIAACTWGGILSLWR